MDGRNVQDKKGIRITNSKLNPTIFFSVYFDTYVQLLCSLMIIFLS